MEANDLILFTALTGFFFVGILAIYIVYRLLESISDDNDSVPFYVTERGKKNAVAKIGVRAHEKYVASQYPGLRQTGWKRFKRWL